MDTNEPMSPDAGSNDGDLVAGTTVGEYVVEKKIGEGGFGTVFRAEHPLIGKLVAIKVLSLQYSADPAMVGRFVAEARAVNQIRHRNMIDIFSFGKLPDGRHYYVMEYLEGSALDEYLESKGHLGLDEAIPILRAVGRALDAAHENDIAHRDLKPENIFLATDREGIIRPKLLDFGIAKLLHKDGDKSFKTQTGAPIGTPYYMSPEQCRGRDVDHRTDIYAFGCVVYRLITGQLPFDGEDHMDILIKQLNEEPIPPSQVMPGLSPKIDAAVAWMLAKDPEDRPPNLASAIAALEEAASASGVMVPAETDASAVMAASTVKARLITPIPGSVSQMGVAPTVTPAMGGPGVGAASTFSTSAMGDELPAAGGSRKIVLIAAAAVLLIGGGLVVFSQMGDKDGGKSDKSDNSEMAAQVTQPPVDPKPAAIVQDPADAAPVVPEQPAKPTFVTLQIKGAPRGTEVYGPLGPVGVAPGTVQLPYGDEAIQLTFKHKRFETMTEEVVPSEDGVLQVALTRKRAGNSGGKGGGQSGNTGNKDSVEDPFK